MKKSTNPYAGHRYPREIIAHAVWLYHRFSLSFRDVEDLLVERGITVSYESIRLWCLKFAQPFTRSLRRRQGPMGDAWYLDEVFITINGKRQYLWRAVDDNGDVLDILAQSRRDKKAAKRFFRKLLKGAGEVPTMIVTDKLASYGAARREVMSSATHETGRWMNNKAELSHQPTRQRERQMRRFKSPGQAQRFLAAHGIIRNLFHLSRHTIQAKNHRLLRDRAFETWREATCATNSVSVD